MMQGTDAELREIDQRLSETNHAYYLARLGDNRLDEIAAKATRDAATAEWKAWRLARLDRIREAKS